LNPNPRSMHLQSLSMSSPTAPTNPAAEDAARCCSPTDCSHRAMTASLESPAAADVAMGLLLGRQVGIRRRNR